MSRRTGTMPSRPSLRTPGCDRRHGHPSGCPGASDTAPLHSRRKNGAAKSSTWQPRAKLGCRARASRRSIVRQLSGHIARAVQDAHDAQRIGIDLIDDQIPDAHRMKTHAGIGTEVATAMPDVGPPRQQCAGLNDVPSSVSAAGGLSAATKAQTSNKSERASSLRTNPFIARRRASATPPSVPSSRRPAPPGHGLARHGWTPARLGFFPAHPTSIPHLRPGASWPGWLRSLHPPRRRPLFGVVLNELFKGWSERHVHGRSLRQPTIWSRRHPHPAALPLA